MKNFLSSRFIKFIALSLIGVILAINVFSYYFYHLAEEKVLKNNFGNIPNRSLTEFYFAPLVLKQNGKLSRDIIIEHLRTIAYQENGEGSGSFSLDRNQLRIKSRFPQLFPDASVTFKKDVIASIAVDNQSVEQLMIEPLPMRTDIHFIHGDEYPADKRPKDQRTRRIVIKPDNIPQMVKDVITSSEDYKFFENQGIDWIAIPKRLFSLNGASGIGAQIAKNNFHQGAPNDAFWNVGLPDTLERKLIAEPFIALALDNNLSKDELFAAYLNLLPYGASSGIELQGIVSASQEFFGKTQLSELTLAETATLAAMINRPTAYLNFVRNGNFCPEAEKEDADFLAKTGRRWNRYFGTGEPKSNKKQLPPCKNLLNKRNIVLDLVFRNHPDRYSREIIDEAKTAPLEFVFASENRETRLADVYSGMNARFVLTNLPDEVNLLRSEEGNIKVLTTFDSRLQKAAFEISEEYLRQLYPLIDKAFARQKARNPEKVEKILNDCAEQNREDAANGKTASCDVDKLFKPQIALVAMDAQTGEILSMVGGVNTQFNFAAMGNRERASCVKPFFYAKALESGKTSDGLPVTAATYIDKEAVKTRFDEMCVEDKENLGSSGSLHYQLMISSNIGACAVAEFAGIPNDFLGQLLKNKPPKSLQIALGAGAETTLINLVQAYTIFPNNGKFVTATAYKNTYQDNRLIEFTQPKDNIRTSPEAAFIVTNMLKSVVEKGTAAGFRNQAKLSPSVQFAGKTGSGQTSDLSFVGFTPRMVLGVWVGIDRNFPELRIDEGFSGGKTAAPIAAKFMQAVGKYRPDLLQGEFTQPQNVVKLRVNEKGCLVKAGGREEFFIVGREPTVCN